MSKKKIIDWFDELEESVRIRAFYNTSLEKLQEETGSLEGAIDGAFKWSLTPESFDYWNQIHTRSIERKRMLENSLKINHEYDAIILHKKKRIEVGCQTISFKVIDKLYKIIHSKPTEVKIKLINDKGIKPKK